MRLTGHVDDDAEEPRGRPPTEVENSEAVGGREGGGEATCEVPTGTPTDVEATALATVDDGARVTNPAPLLPVAGDEGLISPRPPAVGASDGGPEGPLPDSAALVRPHHKAGFGDRESLLRPEMDAVGGRARRG